MKSSVTALSVVALLVVSLGLVVAVAAEGEAVVDPANFGEPGVEDNGLVGAGGGELPDSDPATDTDDLGPINDDGAELYDDEIEGDYDGDMESPYDDPEFGPSEDFDADDAANDEDMVIEDEFPEDFPEDEDDDDDDGDDDESVLYEDGYDVPESGDTKERRFFDVQPDNEEAPFAVDGLEGREVRHQHNHDHHPRRGFRCHPAHIALFVLVAVAIGLAGRRVRRQRRAAFQSVVQPTTNGEVPVVVVMGKLKEDDDDVSHSDNIPLQGQVV